LNRKIKEKIIASFFKLKSNNLVWLIPNEEKKKIYFPLKFDKKKNYFFNIKGILKEKKKRFKEKKKKIIKFT
jgi:hypothetical protein